MSTINVRDGVMQIVNRHTAAMKLEVMEYLDSAIDDNRKLRKKNRELTDKVKELETLRGLDKPKTVAIQPKHLLSEALTDENVFLEGKLDDTTRKLYFDDTSDRLYKEIGLDKKEGATSPGHKPVLLVAKDTSGSMGVWEQYMSNCITSWTVNMLARKYGQRVDVRYVLYTTEAREVSEDDFRKSTESGGTLASSAGELLNKIADGYNYETTDDIHVLLLTDGDNLTSDTQKFINYIRRLAGKSKDVWYTEANQYNSHSTIRAGFEVSNKAHGKIGAHCQVFKKRDHIPSILKNMFNRTTDREVSK
ncbi:putative sporulation protein [Bacillus phage Z3]|nr:putative sporulation protein [Bacillus phage Z3]